MSSQSSEQSSPKTPSPTKKLKVKGGSLKAGRALKASHGTEIHRIPIKDFL